MPGVHHVINYSEPFYNQNGQTWSVGVYADDWVFFANKNGVLQYNGCEWTEYHLNNGADVRSVYPSRREGRVYVGGINEFGYLAPDKNGFIKYHSLSEALGNTALIGNMWGIYATEKEDVYVQGDHGLVLLSRGKARRINTEEKLNCSNMVKGTMYMGTDDGLRVLIGDRILPVYGGDLMRGRHVRAILPYSNGMIVATAHSGLYYYDGKSAVRMSLPGVEQETIDNLFCATIRDDVVALGTITSGITVVDMKTGVSQRYTEFTGLQDNTALSLAFDSYGNLWAGLDRGIDRIVLDLPMVTIPGTYKSMGTTYDVAMVGDKIYSATNRGLFVATANQFASMLSFTRMPGVVGQAWGVTTVCGDTFCMHDNGLYLIAGGTAVKIGRNVGTWDVIPVEGYTDRVFVGTYEGMYVMRKIGGVWTEVGDMMSIGESVYDFIQEDRSHLWFIKGKVGAVRLEYDPATYKVLKTTLYNSKSGLPADLGSVTVAKVMGRVLFSTPSGIYRYSRERNRIEADRELNARLGKRTAVLHLEQSGDYLFALTPYEMIRLNLKHKTPAHALPILPYGSRHPHPAYTFSVIGDYLAVLPTTGGYSVFNLEPKVNITRRNDRYARINKVTITNRSDSVVYASNFLNRRPLLKIDYSCNSLKFNFGVDPKEHNFVAYYRYRVNDGDWHTLNTNVKEFTGLSEGSYLFTVRAVLSDGMEVEDALRFTIRPPWYRSVVAWIVYALLIIIAGVYIYILMKRKMMEKAEVVAAVKDEEIAREREEHDALQHEKDQHISELEEDKLRGELAHKSNEIVNLLLSVSNKNETLMNIREDLRNIYSDVKWDPEARQSVLNLLRQIDSSIQSEGVLKRVEKEFDLVHDNFIKKVRAQYPELSTNELMMCAYIKMNLSTKEIAPLMNISVRGVETIRYRMRKKLGLDRNDNLSEFLMKL